MKILSATMSMPFIGINKRCRIASRSSSKSDLDTPFHIKRRSSPFNKLDHEDMDKTHDMQLDDSTFAQTLIEYSRKSSATLEIDDFLDELDRRTEETIKPEERHHHYNDDDADMKVVENKFRAYVSIADGNEKDMVSCGADALLDDLYDDEVIHMMDGVAMNKASLKSLHATCLAVGAKRSVEEFRVVDGTHAECVVRTRSPYADILARFVLTVRGGKIVRVGKFENAKAA